jgi:hypothetical protein
VPLAFWPPSGSAFPAWRRFQPDLAGFAQRYHLRVLDSSIWAWLRHVHAQANLTLAPSTAAA